MRQRGRKSADVLALPMVEVPRPQLEPPRGLTKAEQTLFSEIAASAPHLKQSDVPLLASFAQATLLARGSARPACIDTWERATRTQVALARSLRLTAQSRIDPQTLGRQRPPRAGPAPWERS